LAAGVADAMIEASGGNLLILSALAAPEKFEAERFASKAQKDPINPFTWSAIPPRTSRVLLIVSSTWKI